MKTNGENTMSKEISGEILSSEFKAIPPNKRLMDLTEKVIEQHASIIAINRDLLRVLSCFPVAVSVRDAEPNG
jgi:hypothetical protein